MVKLCSRCLHKIVQMKTMPLNLPGLWNWSESADSCATIKHQRVFGLCTEILWLSFACSLIREQKSNGFFHLREGARLLSHTEAMIKTWSHSSFPEASGFRWLPSVLVSHRRSFRFSFMTIWFWQRLHFLRLWIFYIPQICGSSWSEIIVILMNSSIK